MEKRNSFWEKLKNEPLSFKIGLVFGIAHLFLFFVCLREDILFSPPEQLGMGVYMTFFILDIFLLPIIFLSSFFYMGPGNHTIAMFITFTIVHGILGTICWFYIPIGIAKQYSSSKQRRN